ncbi:ATP-binding protein [Halonotius terrestris]|nr:ATP-binding protein [Halonotius terrestris]
MNETRDRDRETALFEAAQELASVGGWEYDIRAETLYCTDEVDRIYGRETKTDVTLSATIERFHPSDRPAVRAALDDAIEAGEAFEGEWRLRPQNGDQRWVRVYGEPERDGDAVVRIRGAIEDITAEKRHKERLNRLFETNRELLEQETADAVATVAVEAAREVLGLSINGIHLHDADDNVLVPTATTDATVDLLGEPPTFEQGEGIAWTVFETGDPRIYDDVRTADGIYNPETGVRSELNLPLGDHGVFIAGSPQPNAFDDRTVSLAKILAANVETALDQLDREQRLRRQNDRLEEFASIVSHDLRNPLSVAKAGIEVARTERGDGDSLDRVDRAHDRMAALIEDLLSLARNGQDIEAGDMETVKLSVLASHAWQSVETSDATLETENNGEVVADPSRLQQLLENLFRNSIEHSSNPVTIRVGTHSDGFYVEDDGPGIPSEKREEVFEAGYTTQDDGTGLGLRIVRTVADAHDWDVTVTHSEMDGARFEITGVES